MKSKKDELHSFCTHGFRSEIVGEKTQYDRDEVSKVLEETPRPHHLFGPASLIKSENVYELESILYFSSNHPSIADRTKNPDVPHVNLGDIAFAMANAGNFIAKLEIPSISHRFISPILIYPLIETPPDKHLNLRARVEERKVLRGRHTGIFYGTISDDKQDLARFGARWRSS